MTFSWFVSRLPRLEQLPTPPKDAGRRSVEIVRQLTSFGMLPTQIHHSTGVPIRTSQHYYKIYKNESYLPAMTSLGRSAPERLVYSTFAAHYYALKNSDETGWMWLVVAAWRLTVADIKSRHADVLLGVDNKALALSAAYAIAQGLRQTGVKRLPGYTGHLCPHVLTKLVRCPRCGCYFVIFEAEHISDKANVCPYCELSEQFQADEFGKRRMP